MKDPVREMIKEADSIGWDCIYSSKGHFSAARWWNTTHYFLGILAATSATILGHKLFDGQNVALSILAFFSAIITATITVLNPKNKAEPHHKAGVEFLDLKRKSRILGNIEFLLETTTENKLSKLEELVEKVNLLNHSAPAIPRIAYETARWGVRRGEASYNEQGEKK